MPPSSSVEPNGKANFHSSPAIEDGALSSQVKKRESAATKNVAILGVTGSIGAASVEVLRHLVRTDPDCVWRLHGASCHRSVDRMVELCTDKHLHRADSKPSSRSVNVVVSDLQCQQKIQSEYLRSIGHGPDALIELASDPEVDILVASIVGSAGLASTLAAAEAGKRIALANKEALVVAGPLLRSAIQSSGGELLPIDSEHSAIFQALGGIDQTTDQAARRASKLILTASGGPFRESSMAEMDAATPAQAMKHPTWDMGPKITIDSATMMNKALEIIEAKWLFDVPADRIEVMVHPQSIIHSMVQMFDGSVIAQMSPPDMKMPIQLALTHPRRLPSIAPTIDFGGRYDLTLTAVDHDRFPAIALGFEVADAGGTAGVVVNAANERAVELFIDGQIRLTEIVPLVRRVLANHHFEPSPTLQRLMTLDHWARDEANVATR